MTKIQTQDEKIDLEGLCLNTNTLNCSPLMKMDKSKKQGPNYKLLTGMILGTIALGMFVPSCNKYMEKKHKYNLPYSGVQQRLTECDNIISVNYFAGQQNGEYKFPPRQSR